MTTRPNIYDLITNRILDLLAEGVVPWRRPWSGEAARPKNLVSGKSYRGINPFLLQCGGYDDPNWLTFRQACELGGAVRKGEKGMPVVFWKWHEVENSETGETDRVPVCRYYTVFNVMQCDLPDDKRREAVTIEQFDFEPIEKCEAVVAAMQQPPKIEYQGHQAVYQPKFDTVRIPEPSRFAKSSEFYSTLYHELVHASGHQSRLNRKGITEPTRFGSAEYAREELIAEIGATFLCGHCGIERETLDNSAAYIDTWMKRLRGDNRLVVVAGAAAQKASDFSAAELPKSHSGAPLPRKLKVQGRLRRAQCIYIALIH